MKIKCPYCNKEIYLSISVKVQNINPKIGNKTGAKFEVVNDPPEEDETVIVLKDPKTDKVTKLKFKS